MNKRHENEDVLTSEVIAISSDGERLGAVKLRKHNSGLDLVWVRSSEPGVLDWQGFSADKDRLWGKEGGGVVVGFDSANVVFYDVQMPEVKPETFSSMVHMQAETRLPLPVDQMEVAFKRGELKDDQVSVTIAAAQLTTCRH